MQRLAQVVHAPEFCFVVVVFVFGLVFTSTSNFHRCPFSYRYCNVF